MINYMIYPIVFVVILFCSKVRITIGTRLANTDQKKIYCMIISVLLIVMLFLKHDAMGNDTGIYRNVYNQIMAHGSFDYIFKNERVLGSSFELGYLCLNLLFARLYIPFRFFMLVLAVFYISSFRQLIYRYSDHPAISYIIFMLLGYFMFFTAMRQALALACTVYSFMFDRDGKRWISLILSIIACTFHKTACLFLAFYIAKLIKWTRRKIILLLAAIAIMQIYRLSLIKLLIKLAGKGNLESGEAGGIPIIIMFAGAVLIGFIYRKQLFQQIEMRIFYVMMLLALATMPLAQYQPYFYRLRHYFAIYIIIFLPNMIGILKKKVLVWLLFVFVLMYGIYLFFGMFQKAQAVRTNPYVFCWQYYPAEINTDLDSHEPLW